MSKKIVIPKELRGDALHQFLVENKSELISQKKSLLKTTDVVFAQPNYMMTVEKDGTLKAAPTAVGVGSIPDDATSVFVKIVCNACNWCDSQMDVLLENSAKRTIQQRKGMIPHLANHEHKLESQVGDVENIYLLMVALKDLGLKNEGATQCIIMESTVRSDYNPKVFNLYKKGKVKQHSIGLSYVEIYLAVNQPDNEYYAAEYKIWKKYYDDIINKDAVDEYGFFWAVKEFKLMENSAVLFGSNELTPTLEIQSKDDYSLETVPETPISDPVESKNDDWSLDAAIITTKFF